MALKHFKSSSAAAGFNVSLFHYRGHGADVARVLVGLQVLHAAIHGVVCFVAKLLRQLISQILFR